MPLEKKHFFLGMNQDIEDRLLKDGEYRYALNVRSGSAEDADVGAITNARGNTLVTYSLPGGINEVIGAYEDSSGSKVIYFLYNSNSRHQILEYSISSNTISLILESGLLNFSITYPIWHIDLVNDDLLFWTDNYNEPSQISIKRAKEPLGSADGYPNLFIRQYLDAIKYPPLCPPTAFYRTEETITSNTLKGRLYQFKYRFVYKDNGKSVWSPISKIVLPVEGQAQYNNADIDKNNSIRISMSTGNEQIKSIELAGKETVGVPNTQIGNLGDFFLIQTFNKEEQSIFSNDNNYQFDWFNDSVYSSINLNESNKLFDRVPIKALCQEFTENRMMYAHLLINYDPVSDFQMTATQVLTDRIPGGENTESLSSMTISSEAPPSPLPWISSVIINPVVSQGDIFILVIAYLGPFQQCSGPFTFTVGPASSTDTVETISTQFITQMNNECTGTAGHAHPMGGPGLPNGLYILGPVTSGSVTNVTLSFEQNLSGFKRGASHEFGVVYSDEKGRTMAVQSENNSSIYIDWYNVSPTGAAEVKLEIFSQPPAWAHTYRIVYSKNQTVDRFIQYTAAEVTVSTTKIKISLLNLVNEKTENQNIVLSYDFSTGDRIRFVKNKVGVFFSTVIDYEILSFDSGTAEITIDNPNISSLGPDMIFELYTPKKTLEDKFFYEIGECFGIGNAHLSNRFHRGSTLDQDLTLSTPAVINLNEGDVYYKLRSMGTTLILGGAHISEVVEDYNFSDFYNSNSISIGRVNVIDDGMKQTRLPATVFVSEVFVPNTNINGLGSFYGYSYDTTISGGSVRAKDYDKRWGSIQRIYAEDKKLNLFQELKVGKALVGESVIFDQTGVPTINKSNEILSDIIYYPGEYGIGIEPGSFAVYGHTKYFADMKRGAVLSLAGNTIKPISKLYMHNYFTDTFKEIMVKKTPQAAIVKNTFFGVYDIKFSEYIISLRHREHPTGTIEIITFPGYVDNNQPDTSYFCFTDPLLILFFSVGDTVQISWNTYIIGPSGTETTYHSIEVEIGTITGDCFIPIAPFDFDPSIYIDAMSITIVNLSNHTYYIRFDPRIEQPSNLYNDFIGINKLNVSFYNRQTEQDDIVTANVWPQLAGPSGAIYVYFIVNGVDIPIDAVNDGDTVTLYDYHFEEYEITTTLAFNSGDERWKTFYSFIPEMMVGSLMEIVTFKKGALYLHNSNDTHNNFYGDQFDSEVHPVSNEEPSARKLYLSMVQESNKVWRADKITNQQGQQSSLIESDFEDIEGDFYAQFLKDENTPVTNPLIEGDDLRSHELKVEMKNKDTGAVKLFSVGFNWSPSERTNK